MAWKIYANLFLDCRGQRPGRGDKVLVLWICRPVAGRDVSVGHPHGQRTGVLLHRLVRHDGRTRGPVGAGRPRSSIRQVGICGGFTTFSTFSLETLYLARDGQWLRAGANVAGSLALRLRGVWAGWAAATWWNER